MLASDKTVRVCENCSSLVKHCRLDARNKASRHQCGKLALTAGGMCVSYVSMFEIEALFAARRFHP